MTNNTDVSDSWEREADDPAFFHQFSPDGYALGINVLLCTDLLIRDVDGCEKHG